ncbi:MAG TPA: hypothetical protein VK653_01290 [Xanthobacteraceae bacterium]|nr:hypothetical protein [Xanthobacteraceae bacterium]
MPERHGIIPIASVGVSPPNFSFFPFVIAGLDPAIHAEVALANASTGICPLQLSMDHRVKRGGDDF